MADQALSSVSNFVVPLLVARFVSTEALGAFALAFATYTVFLNLARALGSQPLVVRFSGPADDDWREAVRAATGIGLATGIVGAVVCAAAAAASDGTLREAFGAMAIGLAGLLLQDAWRFSFFAVGRGRSAFVNDGLWAVTMLPLVGWVIASGPTVFGLVLAWAAGGAVAAVYGMVQSRLRPSFGRIRAWWRAQRDLGTRYAAEIVTAMFASQAVLFAVGAISGLHAVGALRAGQLLVGPVTILLMGVTLVAVPEAVAAAERGRSAFLRLARVIALGLGGTTAVYGVLVLLVPQPVGSALLASSWEAAQPVLPAVVLASVALALAAAPTVGLRSLAAAGRSLRATAIGAVLALGLGIAGAFAGHAAGAAWGLVVAGAIGLAVWIREFRGEVNERWTSVPGSADPGPADASSQV